MAVGNGRPASLAARCSPSQPRYLRGRGSLVDEDQRLGIEVKLAVEPSYAAAQDIGALLFRGVRSVVFSRSQARISATVMSGADSINPRMKASWASSFERDGWPCLRASVSPVSR